MQKCAYGEIVVIFMYEKIQLPTYTPFSTVTGKVSISITTLVSDKVHLFTGWGDIPKDKS